MSGITQELPPDATGAAVGVFLYSSFCLFLSTSLLWATIAHREWKSYVGLLAFFPSLSTLASMAQQLHTYLRWSSIKLAQFDYVRANAGNPELSVAGPSVGIDIAFFYIQYYCYNVEAILVVSWCTQLAHTIYHLKPSSSASRYGSLAAKGTAIILPIIQVSLMRATAVQHEPVVFYLIANAPMGISLAGGVVLLLAILGKYVSTRTETSWHVRYADNTTIDDVESVAQVDTLGTFNSDGGVPLHKRSIYDNWLVVRFTIAFAGLSVFQLMVILSEISNALSNDETLGHKTVNLRASQAVADIQAFIPGVSASILAFVVFGTTKTFRDYFYRKFVPRRIRRARALKRRAKGLSTIEIQPRPARRARPTDSTMYPPAPRRTSTTVAVPYYQPPSPGARVECFELDGGDGGFGKHKTMSTHELAVPTPTYSTFELQKQGDDEDRMPILKIKPTG